MVKRIGLRLTCLRHHSRDKDDPPTLVRGNVATRNRTHEINAKINVTPTVTVCHVSRSQWQGMSVQCPLECLCNPYVCLCVTFPVEDWNYSRDYGSEGHGTQEYHRGRSRMLMLSTSMQSSHLRRQRVGCFSSTDLVVVQHMFLSGFDRLDPVIQKPVYSFNSFRCSWNRVSQSRCLQRWRQTRTWTPRKVIPLMYPCCFEW